MKVLLFFEKADAIKKSGIGRAFKLQEKSLALNNVEYTSDYLDESYDVLHINTTFLQSKPMIKEARKAGKAVVYHAHSTYEDFRNSFRFSNVIAPFWKRRLIKLYSLADIIITPTEYSKRLLLNYGIKTPIYVNSNGVELDRFNLENKQREVVLKHFGFADDDKFIVSVGLWMQRKGLLDFIEVAKMMPQYKFIWFGSSPRAMTTGKILSAIEDNCPENVYFPGYIPSGDPLLENAFMTADVFFFPSYEETEGIVILEALSCKQNIVARDIPVYHPWLKHNVNSFLGKNNQDFVNLINDVIDKKTPEVGEEAFKTAAERDIKIVGENLKKYYEIAIEINNKMKSKS